VACDCEIQADAYRAPGDVDQPVILWIHGGALIMGNRTWINSTQLQKYLDAGLQSRLHRLSARAAS